MHRSSRLIGTPRRAFGARRGVRRVLALARALVVLALATAFVAPAVVRAADAPRLRAALRKSTVVGVGRITAATDVDYGRLRVYEFDISQRLKPATPQPEIAAGPETTGAAEAAQQADTAADTAGKPPVPTETILIVVLTDEPGAAQPDSGQSGVAFVRPLRRNSYIDTHLARDEYYSFVGGRDGWLGAPSAERLPDIARPVETLTGFSRRPDSAVGPRGRRDFVFALLAAPHPLLADDGIVSLATIPYLSTSVTESEIEVISAALRNSNLPMPTRRKLIAAIASADLRQLIETLRNLDEPPLQRASWAALRKMDAAPDDDAMREKLAHRTAAVRIAAAHELLERDPAEGARAVTSIVLNDPDRTVRMDVIEALGESGATEAVAPLERVYASTGSSAGGADLEQQQAATRALLAIGGDPAADALHRLAFVGTASEQRYAAFALLSLGVGVDDPRVVDILERSPDEKMSEMILDGLTMGHHH